jgi:hypothetical protein
MTDWRRRRAGNVGRRRREGATFTLFVIVFAVMLLAGASAYVATSQKTLQRAGLELRTSRLREAVFSGVRWASRAADQGLAEGSGRFDLQGAKVETTFRRANAADGLTLTVTSTATGVERSMTCEATLHSVADRFQIQSFTLTQKTLR